MRPADAGRNVDSRTRRIEQGAWIVAAPPGGVEVLLQMPRGNLETVYPRFLVLPAVARVLDAQNFAEAFALCARHRVDLNLVVDRGWPRFLLRAEAFVRSVDDPDAVAELLEALDPGDCTAPGNLYGHLPPPSPVHPDEEVARADFVALESFETARAALREGGREVSSDGTKPSKRVAFDADADEPDEPDAFENAKRDDPRGKIRLVCAAVARAVARRAAKKATETASESEQTETEQTETVGSTRSSGEVVDVDAILPDRWELVMLSAKARSSPPDLEGALRRVRELRAREIRDAFLSRGVPVQRENNRVDSDISLDHLFALEGGQRLFAAALGTYDLSLAFLVGQKSSGMDPGEYVPELERLRVLPEPLRKAEIDLKLGRFREAVENALAGGDVEKACEIARKKKLFPHALVVSAALETQGSSNPTEMDPENAEHAELGSRLGAGCRATRAGGGDAGDAAAGGGGGRASVVRSRRNVVVGGGGGVSPTRLAVAEAYASYLSARGRHEDAAVLLVSVGNLRGAVREYVSAGAPAPALSLAGRLQLPPPERLQLAATLVDQLEPFDPAAAAAVAERELGDIDRSVQLLCQAGMWRDCSAAAYGRGRGDLVETVVAPAAAREASAVAAAAAEAPARAEKYLDRLRKLRRHREALDLQVGVAGGSGFGGKPGGGVAGDAGDGDGDGDGDVDADLVSESGSVSTLASGVSGFSAYTTGTFAGSSSGFGDATSKSASTIGGRTPKPRKPSRKERRGKKPGAGLRAGGPTEERDLATYLSGDGIAAELFTEGALDRIGELLELLVILGHPGDAERLQSAVARAVRARDDAAAEAREALKALDRFEKRTDAERLEGDSKPSRAPSGSVGETGDPPHDARERTAALKRAKWKWAALRKPSSG
jgi:elongator complex protein 1